MIALVKIHGYLFANIIRQLQILAWIHKRTAGRIRHLSEIVCSNFYIDPACLFFLLLWKANRFLRWFLYFFSHFSSALFLLGNIFGKSVLLFAFFKIGSFLALFMKMQWVERSNMLVEGFVDWKLIRLSQWFFLIKCFFICWCFLLDDWLMIDGKRQGHLILI